MIGTVERRKIFVENLNSQNREFYGTPDGRGILSAIELTFDQPWVYLYELVQNALDVGARSIALRVSENDDALVYQHDGNSPLCESDVEALSKIFRSTKGARSVGFMGIGFKSVFLRFQEARISGWSWKFRYEITQTVGEEFGDKQRNLLGAVIPIWDDEISIPKHGFTTRFEMRRRTDERTGIGADLKRFLPNDDRTSLAILAMSGLERLEIDGRIWELATDEQSDGSFKVTAISENENRLWRVFSANFQPSREAVACFLEHRRIQPTQEDREQVYAEAACIRRVLGVLPLDNDGMPVPPTRGRVYATLPTEVTLPFGLHINADWLLNISRGDLREIEDNAWQRGIVERVANLLASFLEWSADTLSEPRAVKAAFKVLAPPLSETDGLEALFADERWMSRLRGQLENAAVFPVWTDDSDTLDRAKPGDILVPPAPLGEAFRKQPELRPSALLKGSVLRSDLLGLDALRFLRRIGLFAEMSPQGLEHAWEGGLEDWWRTLPGEKDKRRRFLFRIWAAVAELTSESEWLDIDLPCVRSVTRQWLIVQETAFLNETLPAKNEPGGPETLQLMLPVIPDANRLDRRWIAALRQRKREDTEYTLLSKAWNWIEGYAQSIGLREIVEDAVNALLSSSNPDRSVLVPFGYWAKHRGRPKLLTHVLAESKGELLGLPVGDALLADPYIESGQSRRLLFPEIPAISAIYLKGDPKNSGAHEWRTFFEKAGAKGMPTVNTIEAKASRWYRATVAEFLGLKIGPSNESNNDGYTLLDFDIELDVPDQDSPQDYRNAFANWINDGYGVLKHKGRRLCTFHYYSEQSIKGNFKSKWAAKLSEREWVPCIDGQFRCPKDLLPRDDPAREDAPVARLSSDLVSMLENEGVEFGTEIPEATSLRKLSAVGSRLNAEALARLLSECREQIETATDRDIFGRALQTLTVPSSDGPRVTLDRIVQRAGGRSRGALGGWIVSLNGIDEILRLELTRSDFPFEFPETTTGDQALNYIHDIWRRSRSTPEGLATEVRDVLPTAYTYCLEDCAENALLSKRWNDAVTEASVFAEREWVVLTEADDIRFDDIEDRRFLPSEMQGRTVTGGHLGNSRSEQLRTVRALGLPLLSSFIELNWRRGDRISTSTSDWDFNFDLICELLRRVRENIPGHEDGNKTELGVRPALVRVEWLAVDVRVDNGSIEHVPVNARIHDGALTVAGRPVQFSAEAAKELLREFSFGQRGELAADLTGMLTAIDDEQDFGLAADKFRRSHAPEFELPRPFLSALDNGEAAGSGGGGSSQTADATEMITGQEAGAGPSADRTLTQSAAEIGRPDLSDDANAPAGQSSKSETKESQVTGGSYTKDRSLARQNALAEQLKSALKGELVPEREEESATEAEANNGDSIGRLGDEEYRNVAAQYEKEAGREPQIGDPHQSGWDIRSIDPNTERVRLIEVKGKGCPWDEDEVVELTRAQMRTAFEDGDLWYLYVVERTDDGSFRVLPIQNPANLAAKWILPGKSWRTIADEPKRIAGSPNRSKTDSDN